MEKYKETWVTTLDNPFDPFKQYDAWQRWDEDHGYYTLSLICRYLNTSDDLGEAHYYKALEDAVDKIVHYNFTGNYRKVVNNA